MAEKKGLMDRLPPEIRAIVEADSDEWANDILAEVEKEKAEKKNDKDEL